MADPRFRPITFGPIDRVFMIPVAAVAKVWLRVTGWSAQTLARLSLVVGFSADATWVMIDVRHKGVNLGNLWDAGSLVVTVYVYFTIVTAWERYTAAPGDTLPSGWWSFYLRWRVALTSFQLAITEQVILKTLRPHKRPVYDWLTFVEGLCLVFALFAVTVVHPPTRSVFARARSFLAAALHRPTPATVRA